MDNITAKTQRLTSFSSAAKRNSFLRNQPTNCADSFPAETRFKTGASLFQTELTKLVILRLEFCCVLTLKVQFKSADFMQSLWVSFKVWKCDMSRCFVWGCGCIYIYSEPATRASNFSLDRCEWCLCSGANTVCLSLPRISHLLNIPERILTSHSQKTIRNMWVLHVLPFSDSGFPSPVG